LVAWGCGWVVGLAWRIVRGVLVGSSMGVPAALGVLVARGVVVWEAGRVGERRIVYVDSGV